ncbi:3-dehydroquinate synthase [Algivirga pacifica]|uniref:3-dehydroquinate synthase n=1 Tax=Algivirga pacifica TaxID=1162670 RepID=A0ABP9DDE5_9BACT
MMIIQQQFDVRFDYPVIFTNDLFSISNKLLCQLFESLQKDQPAKVFFVVDTGVAEAHPQLEQRIMDYCDQYDDHMELLAPILLLEGGEGVKNSLSPLKTVLSAINDYAIDKHAYVIAIGGGAVLDAVGFAAAVAHRGVRHIRIPTTVLSQDDSGVGVKNGINAFGKKNFLGAFAPPQAVINDTLFLKTLCDRDWFGGVSEAVKVALIKDREFFEQIEKEAPALVNRDLGAMGRVVYRCAELHSEHIGGSGDPFEKGTSRPLDFGHWAAHKLEQMTNYQLRHGEAVAIGIALDVTYSYLTERLSEQEWERIMGVLQVLQLPIYHKALEEKLVEDDFPLVLEGLQEFQEHLGGELTIMLLEQIGRGVEVHCMDTPLLIKAINRLREYAEKELAEKY